MAFQLRDETVGRDILYIDNSGNAGLGTLPIGGSILSVQSTGIVNSSGNFQSGLAVPGTPLTITGTVDVPAGQTIVVNVSYSQTPIVTSSTSPNNTTQTQISWSNDGSSDEVVSYNLW